MTETAALLKGCYTLDVVRVETVTGDEVQIEESYTETSNAKELFDISIKLKVTLILKQQLDFMKTGFGSRKWLTSKVITFYIHRHC